MMKWNSAVEIGAIDALSNARIWALYGLRITLNRHRIGANTFTSSTTVELLGMLFIS